MFTLDTNAAKKADLGNAKIDRTGKFIGLIERAVLIKSKTGTKGVELWFKSDAGEKATLPIYTEKADGEKLMGNGLFMTVMAVLKLREAKPKEKTYKVYDYDTKTEVGVVLQGLPDIEGKRIGVLIETEDSEYNGKTYLNKPIPVMFFQDGTELSATEVLNGETEPKAVSKRVQTLKHRPIKGGGAKQVSNGSENHANQSIPHDDDIPF